MSFNKNSILLSILCSTTLIQTAAVTTPSNVYHQIIPLITKKINKTEPTDAQKHLLTAAEIFLQHGSNHSVVNSELIQAISSVDFFSDILPQYFQPNTHSGTIQTGLLATQMTDDFNELAHRQSIIKHFKNHPDLLNKLNNIFAQARIGEEALLNSFTLDKETIEVFGTKLPINEQLYYTSHAFKSFNNKYILETGKRFSQLSSIAIIACTGWMINLKRELNWIPLFDNQITDAAYIAYLALVSGLSIQTNKIHFDLIYNQQKQLIKISELTQQIKKISNIISKDEILKNLFSEELAKLQDLFNPTSKTTSDNLKYVISELLSSSFEGDPTYYFSKQGKILATHYYLNACKAELIPYLEAFGKIDAYISAAKLYQKFQNHPRVKFCLPEFVNAATPVLDITNYWHPLIDPNIVVTNSVNMGNDVKNLIITGPNAGGKTTSLMSLMINIIFAQSFGIAPSAKLVMTPFAKIHSYLDITTNLQEGLSLFAAEVDRAKKLKNSILSCTSGQKTFTIIDEIFSGTNPDVASDVGSQFATQLGDMNHSMTIITTHFPALTKVGQDTGTFTNYKVADATIMPDGKIVYPFKLIPGISTQNIAQHMLTQQGII